jgi:hypothetical protein
VGQYYVELRSVLRLHPRLRPCVCRCRQCRIFFLTHPRNAGRQDLRCPFGCRAAHQRRSSNERSRAYYRSEVGRVKKRALNGKRGQGNGPAHPRRPAVARPQTLQWEGMRFDVNIVCYVRMVVRLIEGRRVSEGEIRKMLVRAVRQHRMARRRRIEYVLSYFQNGP